MSHLKKIFFLLPAMPHQYNEAGYILFSLAKQEEMEGHRIGSQEHWEIHIASHIEKLWTDLTPEERQFWHKEDELEKIELETTAFLTLLSEGEF
mmetsp:Transcript_1498/g.3138  ORF Transcript_1498/g.3138 Transcript_1498/m.3138 type:complete len:94 (+) Transcript_1498:214-495(+)